MRTLPTITLTLGLGSLLACGGPADEGYDVDGVELESTADAARAKVRILGTLRDGQTRRAAYSNPPEFRGYRLQASRGQGIDLWARAASWRADAVMLLLGPDGALLAENDDADSTTLDAHLALTAPADGEYQVWFRDYGRRDGRFAISLELSDPVTCAYDGNTYLPGDSYPANDGCNTCWCDENGNSACTKIACPSCDPANEPNRNYVGTPEQCARIRYVCADGFQPFSNACGCGCERPADSCEFQGHVMPSGTSFYDGCNQCACGEGGIACTKRACGSCNPENEPWRTYTSNDVWACNSMTQDCPAGQEPFFNTCGCGCAAPTPTCEYAGATYLAGDSFPSSDGCNTCACMPSGLVACTLRYCGP